jgi:hypothetical protein
MLTESLASRIELAASDILFHTQEVSGKKKPGGFKSPGNKERY